jgi:predicted metalloprotease
MSGFCPRIGPSIAVSGAWIGLRVGLVTTLRIGERTVEPEEASQDLACRTLASEGFYCSGFLAWSSIAISLHSSWAQNTEVQFVSFVLDDVQATWQNLLPAQTGKQYRHAKLVLFRDSIESPCGLAQSATGPFYCPEDEKVYLDLGFFDQLKNQFGAPGEFAQAYVIAHEIGHHIQKILGIESKVERMRDSNPSQVNPLSVRVELQADCFAGVWANASEQRRNNIHAADIKDGLQAAAAVGDDRLQKMATGHVSPETFTHGTSQQRDHWFQTGLNSGQISACNTFASAQ